jgi:hypothetical protein
MGLTLKGDRIFASRGSATAACSPTSGSPQRRAGSRAEGDLHHAGTAASDGPALRPSRGCLGVDERHVCAGTPSALSPGLELSKAGVPLHAEQAVAADEGEASACGRSVPAPLSHRRKPALSRFAAAVRPKQRRDQRRRWLALAQGKGAQLPWCWARSRTAAARPGRLALAARRARSPSRVSCIDPADRLSTWRAAGPRTARRMIDRVECVDPCAYSP